MRVAFEEPFAQARSVERTWQLAGRALADGSRANQKRDTDWLTMQSDIQYIINPGMDPALDGAFVVGLRVILSSILE